jgi:hypothetical protein
MGDRWMEKIDDNEVMRIDRPAGSANEKQEEARTCSGDLT